MTSSNLILPNQQKHETRNLPGATGLVIFVVSSSKWFVVFIVFVVAVVVVVLAV